MNICCIEFSNILTDEKRNVLDIMNRELFYSFKAKDGYKKTMDFTEFPQWVNHVKGMVDFPIVLHICRNIQDTVNYLSTNDFDYILFSNIVCTSEYIKQIIESDYKKTLQFIIGTGIGSTKIKTNNKNVFQYDSMVEFAKIHSFGRNTILNIVGGEIAYNTRIYTTYGCRNKCLFCKNDGVFGLLTYSEIAKYNSIIKSDLVYIGNKTFLQGGINELNQLGNYTKNTFIVQSCISTLLENISLFNKMHEVGIRIVEIGIESFSKDTLKRLGKYNDLEALPIIVKALTDINIKVIFNIMVGIKGDTIDDYNTTIKELEEYSHWLYSLNITYYSDYDSIIQDDKDERILIKSWIKDDMVQATKEFAEKLYKINYKLITK